MTHYRHPRRPSAKVDNRQTRLINDGARLPSHPVRGAIGNHGCRHHTTPGHSHISTIFQWSCLFYRQDRSHRECCISTSQPCRPPLPNLRLETIVWRLSTPPVRSQPRDAAVLLVPSLALHTSPHRREGTSKQQLRMRELHDGKSTRDVAHSSRQVVLDVAVSETRERPRATSSGT